MSNLIELARSVPKKLRRDFARWLLDDVSVRKMRIEELLAGQNTITTSPAGVGDVLRWSATKNAVALGDIGMDVTTGRPNAFVGGVAAALALQSEAGGVITKVQNYATAAVATGTTQTPVDDTIPQVTEGTEFMSSAFTPLSASSSL